MTTNPSIETMGRSSILRCPEVQIHPLHDPQFLQSTVSFVHSTAKFLHSTPPDSFTPLQNSFTPRPRIPSLHCKIPLLHAPRFLHSTAKFLHATIPCVTVISVPFLRRKSQLPSDGHSSIIFCIIKYFFRGNEILISR